MSPTFEGGAIASIYDAWKSFCGIRILEEAIRGDKTPDALDTLLGELERVGYIHPDKAILPPVPILRGNYGEDKPPSDKSDKSNDTLDEDLVRRFGQVLATAHIYFLRRLNNARETSWYLLYDNIDRARLPSNFELDDKSVTELKAKIRREDVTSIQHVISVFRGDAPEKSSDAIYKLRRVQEIGRAVERSIFLKSRTIVPAPQISQSPTTTKSITSEKVPEQIPNKSLGPTNLAGLRGKSATDVATQQRPSKPIRESVHAVGIRRADQPTVAETAIVSSRSSVSPPTQKSATGPSQLPAAAQSTSAHTTVDATNFQKFLFKADVLRPKDTASLVARAKALKPSELTAAWRITLNALQEADRALRHAPSGARKEDRHAFYTGAAVLDAEAKARGIDLQAPSVDPMAAPHVGTSERGNQRGGREH